MSKARDLANAGTALGAVTATELAYVDGVTSAIQTQIDSKIGSASAINPTIVDAKGDIIAATAADTVARLAVGANDTVLTADSSTATGLKWATPAAGGMTLISTSTMSGTTFTISSIPQTYNSLYLVITGVTNATSDNNFRLFPNNVNNLADTMRILNGSAASTTDSNISLSGQQNLQRTNADNVWTMRWDNYTSTTGYKTFNFIGSYNNSTPTRSNIFAGGTFESNTALTSLVFDVEGTVAFLTGTILLYGVK